MVETDGPLGAFRAKEWPGVGAPDRLFRVGNSNGNISDDG